MARRVLAGLSLSWGLQLSLAGPISSTGTGHLQHRQDYFPPHWTALGDSYSAGPGAGTNYDTFRYGGKRCYRGTGAYAPQLDALDIDDLGTFQFLSCTGHVTANVTQYQLPDLFWGGFESDMHVSLSIGGNDLLFSKYVKGCLIGLRWIDCDETVREIVTLIDNTDGKNTFRNALESVWLGIVSDQHYRYHRMDYVPPIAHTLYPTFFNAETDHCDNERILGVGPKLKKQLRAATNDLVQRANRRIAEHALNFQLDNMHWPWRGKINTLDYNPRWDGHRLCEGFYNGPGPGFSDPRIWILGVGAPDSEGDDVFASEAPEVGQVDIATCNPDSNDLGEAVGCEVARYHAQHPDEDLGELLDIPKKWLTKAFHPKTAGFREVAAQIRDSWFPSHRPALRVLALGDSITNGFQSTDGSGYRKEFYTRSTEFGQFAVDMVGSAKAGSFADTDHEGHNGAVISEISTFADRSLGLRPNVVLLHAGTNDMASDTAAAGAVDRLASLVDKIMRQCPDATLLVAKIVSSNNPATQARINAFNAGVEDLVATRSAAGKHIVRMSMDQVVPAQYLFDGIHPNDEGYARMGDHWWGGVQFAYNQDWLRDPVAGQTPAPGGHVECPTVPTWLPQGTIATGGGLGNGSVQTRTCAAATCDLKLSSASEKACLKYCTLGFCDQDESSGQWKCLECSNATDKCFCEDRVGNTNWLSKPSGSSGSSCSDLNDPYITVLMADIDGDGRDDYLHVDSNGAVTMYWNTGRAPDEGANAGQVQWVGLGVIATGVGARGDQVRFADLDGDGRADYIWVKDSGAATVWWNLGFDAGASTKVIWHSATGEEIATGIGDGQGVVFADMNGDGKDDFIHLADNGAATLYINQGRRDSGEWGWWEWGVVATGVGTSRDDIRFTDLNGDGRDDYISVDQATGGLQVWYNRGTESGDWGSVAPIVWWNPGKPVASGVSYLDVWSSSTMVSFGDLNGDGRHDYLYIGAEDSSIYAFINGC